MPFDLSTPLFFIRHGETFYNAEGRIQGQLDTPLSPRGRAQATEVGALLAEAIGAQGLDAAALAYWASPLSRAADTMTLAREALGLPAEPFQRDPRLMELSFGRWQNLTWPEIAERDPGGMAARRKDVWNFRPPGGECYADLAARVRIWLDELTGPTVAAAHGGVARALMVLIGGVAPADSFANPIHQGRALVFANGRGRWV